MLLRVMYHIDEKSGTSYCIENSYQLLSLIVATMEITGTNNSAASASAFVLKSANEQAKLAGELISMTVDNMVQIQAAQTPAQRTDISEISGTGKIINITA